MLQRALALVPAALVAACGPPGASLAELRDKRLDVWVTGAWVRVLLHYEGECRTLNDDVEVTVNGLRLSLRAPGTERPRLTGEYVPEGVRLVCEGPFFEVDAARVPDAGGGRLRIELEDASQRVVFEQLGALSPAAKLELLKPLEEVFAGTALLARVSRESDVVLAGSVRAFVALDAPGARRVEVPLAFVRSDGRVEVRLPFDVEGEGTLVVSATSLLRTTACENLGHCVGTRPVSLRARMRFRPLP